MHPKLCKEYTFSNVVSIPSQVSFKHEGGTKTCHILPVRKKYFPYILSKKDTGISKTKQTKTAAIAGKISLCPKHFVVHL